jgi:hypothetical protein
LAGRRLILSIAFVAGLRVATCGFAQSVHPSPPETAQQREGFSIPDAWIRRGVVLERSRHGAGSSVCGDPCIVWDEAIGGLRMVLFYSPPGNAQAVCSPGDLLRPGHWKFEGPLRVTNPQAVGGFHKPFIVMDPEHPNRAAKIEGRYCLLVVSDQHGHKEVQRAWSENLAGPWTFESEVLIPPGRDTEFDGKHTDAVTDYYFAKRKEFLYFYMGYPRQSQTRKISSYGSAQAVATQKLDEPRVVKRGVILEPSQHPGHWASGWVGGLQLLRGRKHRWVAVVNASPTAPDPNGKSVWTEEPPPSLGGFAWCDEEWPTHGWHFAPTPIEWVKDIPKSALEAGEGDNLWRQFIHVLPDGRAALFYNSGYYGQEQLYLKESVRP